jgi:hypothetical protein
VHILSLNQGYDQRSVSSRVLPNQRSCRPGKEPKLTRDLTNRRVMIELSLNRRSEAGRRRACTEAWLFVAAMPRICGVSLTLVQPAANGPAFVLRGNSYRSPVATE